MNYMTKLTAKSQITIPKSVKDKIGLMIGERIAIYPTQDGGFIGKPQRKSNIMNYFGDLAHLDDGRPFKEIREEAQKAAADYRVSQLKKATKLYRIKLK